MITDQLFLKIRDLVMPGKREELLDTRPPRKMIRQIEELDNITKNTGAAPSAVLAGQGVSGDQDPYAIASAPDNQSPNRNGGVMPSVAPGQNVRLPCSNLPTKLFGVFR